MIDTLKKYLLNLPGVRTNRQLLIIESDDWGSIRMPNKAVYRNLQKINASPENDPYLKYDSLASEDDLQALFEVLQSVKDIKGNPVKITANCVVANPDFNQIKKDDFEHYSYEFFTDTLKSYPQHSNSFQLWKEGVKNNLFWPQYHGREHLNVYQWLKNLKRGDAWLKKAFEHRMISVSSQKTPLKFGYMEGLDFFSEEEKNSKASILIDGMKIFKKHFGYTSKSFIANCYIWDKSVETTLNQIGVKYFQGIPNQTIPTLDKYENHSHVYKAHYMGQKNNLGQRYLIRNVFFEPGLEPNKDWISDCLKRIDIAFKCKKPAIIGSHRLNYIGFINEKNRTLNLEQLKVLLKEVVKRWPSVEFISTDQLESVF